MTGLGHREDLHRTITSALDLLRDHAHPVPPAGASAPAEPLSDLLARCQTLLALAERRAPAPLRTIHHLACSGGTLISRCLGALPNTQILSEADPLSPLSHPSRFLPSDIVGLAKFGSRPPEPETLVRMFLGGLDVLYRDARRHGTDLVLRDHAHSLFTHGPAVPERPSLREMLADYRVLSVVTLRHPLDSYLSLTNNAWLHFTPKTLDEYARRYHAFLDRHADLDWLRYEDFVADPEAVMQRLCRILELSYTPAFRDLFPAITLSGDSGRKGNVIGHRPRRAFSASLLKTATDSAGFMDLLTRMGYDLEA